MTRADDIMVARISLASAERYEAKIRRRAGRAATDRDAINTDLGNATEYFATGNFAGDPVSEWGKRARKIARLASMLEAADTLPAVAQVIAEKRGKLQRLTEGTG